MRLVFLVLIVVWAIARHSRSRSPALPGPMSQRWIAQFLYRDGKEQ